MRGGAREPLLIAQLGWPHRQQARHAPRWPEPVPLNRLRTDF